MSCSGASFNHKPHALRKIKFPSETEELMLVEGRNSPLVFIFRSRGTSQSWHSRDPVWMGSLDRNCLYLLVRETRGTEGRCYWARLKCWWLRLLVLVFDFCKVTTRVNIEERLDEPKCLQPVWYLSCQWSVNSHSVQRLPTVMGKKLYVEGTCILIYYSPCWSMILTFYM